MLRKIEQIVADKTKQLSSIEESLQGLAAQLAQPSCTAELERLQKDLEKAEVETISLQEENLKLRKQILELRRGGASANGTPQPVADTELQEQLEKVQQELSARDSEIADLQKELEHKATANDASIEELSAQLCVLKQQLEEAQNCSDTQLREQEEQLTQAQQITDSLSARVDELQQQLAEALADKEAYTGQATLLVETQQTADALNTRVDELQQLLAEALADKDAYAGQAALLVETQQTADALNARVNELQQLLADAQAIAQTNEQHIAAITTKLEQQSAELERAGKDTAQLQEQLNSSQEQEKQLSARLQSTQDDLTAKAEEAAALTERLSTAETLTTTLQGEKAELTEQLAAGQKEIETFHQMEKRFFPDCILIPSLAPYISDWQAQFISSEPDYKVLSMFSYLFSWSSLMECVRKSPDSLNSNVEKEAISAIAYFSRYFLEALYGKGMSAEEAQNISLELIERFNRVLSDVGTKHQLFVPYLGESYDNKTMTPDSTRGNTFGEVEALLSWGIHNPDTEISYSKCQVQLS